MRENLIERIKDSFSLLANVTIDGITVLVLSLISKGVKIGLERICDGDINSLENSPLKTVYYCSEIIFVVLFVVFVISHLIIEFKKTLNKIRDEK